MPRGCDDLISAAIKTVHKSHYIITLIPKLYITTFRPTIDFFLFYRLQTGSLEPTTLLFTAKEGGFFPEFKVAGP